MQQEIKQEVSFLDLEEFRNRVGKILSNCGEFEISSEKLNDLSKLSVYKEFSLFNPGYLSFATKEIPKEKVIKCGVKAAAMFIYNGVLQIHKKYYNKEKNLNLKKEAEVIFEEFESFIEIYKLETCDSFMDTMKVINHLHSRIVTFLSKDIASELETIHSVLENTFWGGICSMQLGDDAPKVGDELNINFVRFKGKVFLRHEYKKQKKIIILEDELLCLYKYFDALSKKIDGFLVKPEPVDDYTELNGMIMVFEKIASSVYRLFNNCGIFLKKQNFDSRKTNIYACAKLISSYSSASRILMRFISIRYLYEPCIVKANDIVLNYFEGLMDKTKAQTRSAFDSGDYASLVGLIQREYKFYSLVRDFMNALCDAAKKANDHNKPSKEISEKSNKIACDNPEFENVTESFVLEFEKIKSNLEEDKKSESKTM